MASVKAPLFSLDASGSIGKAIVFSKWKGRNYVRRHAVPSNPNSPAQVGIRAAFKFLSQDFASLSGGELATWQALAADKGTTPLNEMIAYNIEWYRINMGMSAAHPHTYTGTAPSIPATWTATAASRGVNLAWTAGANAPDFYWLITRSPTAVFTPAAANAILVLDQATLAYRDTDVVVGTPYWYDIRGYMRTALGGTYGGEVTATPTA